jgi:hypothetical protein
MKVPGQSCPGGFTEIEADIVTLGPQEAIEQPNHPPNRFDRLEEVLAAKLVQPTPVSSGRDQEMSIVIRKSIQDNYGMNTTPNNQVAAVVALGQSGAEKAG